MKIRTGYVSNSSSSSFLVVCKDSSVFDKFRDFNGYSNFIRDFNEKENVNNHPEDLIADFIMNEMYSHFEIFVSRAKGKYLDDEFMKIIQWYDLCQFFSYQEPELRKCRDEISVLGEKFVKKMKNNPKFDWLDKNYNKFHAQYLEIEDRAHDIAKKFLESDNVKGWIIKSLVYADETAEGSFMEHQFMPFMMSCPERDMLVLCENNH